MSDISKATPRPWHYDDKNNCIVSEVITDAGEPDIVLEIEWQDDGAEANAALIVRAVNAHDALVEAAQKVREAFCEAGTPEWRTDQHLPDGYWSPSGRMINSNVMMQLFAALALAEGKP